MNTNHTICVQTFGTQTAVSIVTLIMGLIITASSTVKADITVLSPGASTTIASGTPVTIRWSDDLETPIVNVELWDGVRGTTTILARNVSAPIREFQWTVPEDVQSGTRYRFVVRDARDVRRAILSTGFTALVRRALMPTGTGEEPTPELSMDIAPLPAADRIRISWTEPVHRIEVFDVSGSVVARLEPARGASACLMSVAALGSGSYSVVAHTNRGNVLRRPLMVQR